MTDQKKIKGFSHGVHDGLPICFGYLSVSFAFGIYAAGKGFSALQAVLISMTNVTSAGQLSGVDIIAAGGMLVELALTQLIINLRYALMSVSLSQKFDGSIRLRDRFLLAFVNTDEVFAVASSQKGKVNRMYMYGLILTPYLGWSFGTLLGALGGDIFPAAVTSALGIAIYGMFIAIVLPAARDEHRTALCALFSIALSCFFKFCVKGVPDGFVIIICAVTASALFAYFDCRKKKAEKESEEKAA